MKNITNRKGFFVITTVLLGAMLVGIFFMGMKADVSPNTASLPLGYSGNSEDVTITIHKPSGWKTKETAISITIESNLKIAKVEAKTASNGSFTTITDDMKVTVSENCTVYIQVTDKNGKVYAKSRYLEIFDREAPTVKATITKSLLHVEANDDLSGLHGIYIDGELYTDLTNDNIDIKVSRLGKTYDEITVQAVDIAGNKSKVVTVKNPNHKDDSKDNSLNQQASTTTQPTAGTGTTTTETSGTATGTNTTAPTSSQGANTTSTTSTAASGGDTSSENSSGSGGSGDSSEAPLFGTFEDTQKQFMSIVTKDGAVYYLIIDHDKESENVYFLSEVTNAEVASFTPQGEGITENEEYPEFIGEQAKEEEIGFVNEEKAEVSTDDADTSQNEKEVPSEPADGGATGTYILMVIAILGVGGAGYYFKIYKPKKELESSDDLDDFDFAEDEDDYIFGEEDLDKDEQDGGDVAIEE